MDQEGTGEAWICLRRLQSELYFCFASGDPAAELFAALREANIIVRYFNKPRIDNYLRITIGTQEDMEMLIKFLKNYKK